MIIQCDRCSTKFRLDDSRVTGAGVRVKCTKCQNIFLVTPPEETPVEEILSVASAERPGKDKSIPRSPEGPNLSLDFTPPSERPKGGAQEAPQQDLSQKKGPASFNDLDFNFSFDGGDVAPGTGDGATEDPGESGSRLLSEDEGWKGPSQQESRVDTDTDFSETDAGQGKDLSVDASPFSDFDLGESKAKDSSVEAALPPDLSTEHTGGDTYDFSRPEAEEEERQEPAMPVSGAGASEGSARQDAPLKGEGPSVKEGLPSPAASKDTFSRLLSDSLKKDIKEKDVTVEEADDEDEDVLGFEPEEGFEKEAEAGRPALKSFKKAGIRIPPALIALIVFLVGGGIIYFSGIIDSIARRLAPAEAPKSVEIEDVRVSYVDNQNFGKFFVIEARLKNITDSSQPVKRVTGIAYGKDGEKIMSRSVAPGRVVTPDDLKVLPKEDLERQFKDPSGGSIPPKGTVPVMVIFTEISSGVSEAGVDIAQ